MFSKKQTKDIKKYIRERASSLMQKLFRYQSGVFVFLLFVVLAVGLWMWKDFYYTFEVNQAPIEERVNEMESVIFDEEGYTKVIEEFQERDQNFATGKEFEQIFVPLPEELSEEE